MYGADAIQRLREHAAYEQWALRFITQKQERIDEGPGTPARLIYQGPEKPANVSMAVGEVVGESLDVVDAIAPLRLTTAFKLLDVVVEWVLTDNGGCDWRFVEKIKQVKTSPPTLPELFQTRGFLWGYVFGLYENLVGFRNEIVHNSNFVVNGDVLEVNRDNKVLTLNRQQLLSLGRVCIAITDLLVGNVPWDEGCEARLKYDLDQLSALHKQAVFGIEKPMAAILEFRLETVDDEVDLKGAREQALRAWQGRHHLYTADVTVSKPTPRRWILPSEVASVRDSIQLTESALLQYEVKDES